MSNFNCNIVGSHLDRDIKPVIVVLIVYNMNIRQNYTIIAGLKLVQNGIGYCDSYFIFSILRFVLASLRSKLAFFKNLIRSKNTITVHNT